MKHLRSHFTLTARLFAVAAVAALAACASTPSANYGDVDYAKVAQIERAARVLGTQVIWVHYPTRRADGTTQ